MGCFCVFGCLSEKKIRKRLENTVVKAIRVGEAGLVIHRDHTFEMYGVDVILDENGDEITLDVVDISSGERYVDYYFTFIDKRFQQSYPKPVDLDETRIDKIKLYLVSVTEKIMFPLQSVLLVQ